MADIINTDNGSVAAGKVNDKLATAITSADSGSEWASKVNAKTSAGYVTASDNGSDFADKIANAGGGGGGTTLRVMTLNVGHFADGNSNAGSFTAETYADYVSRFKAFLEDADADIVCVQEYSINVWQQNAAKDVLFDDYPYQIIGNVYENGWLCNAVFSKVPITLIREQRFANADIATRYYQLIQLTVDGKTVGLVNTHLDTTHGTNGVGNNNRNSQFGEVAYALKDYTHAIFGSDSNVARLQDDGIGSGQWEVINYWVNGGSYTVGNYPTLDCGAGYGGGEYTLANKVSGSYIGTWPTTRWAASSANTSGYAAMSCPCDNIAVKRFAVANPTKVDSLDTPVNDITDHCAFYCDLTLIN